MKVQLCVVSDNEREIPVEELPVVIGRGNDVEIPIRDHWASHRHCEIVERQGTLFVRDLGSKHGTLINGSYVVESRLMPGDKLSVGLTTFVVSYEKRQAESNAQLATV